MRRSILGVGLCVAALVLSACTGGPDEALFTVDQARSIGITTEADASPLGALYDDSGYVVDGIDVASYVTEVLAGESAAVDPAECSELLVPLALPASDTDSTDRIFAFGSLLFTEGGAGTFVNQRVRHFSSVDEAKEFVASYRHAFDRCSSFRIAAESGPLEISTTAGPLPVDGEGFFVKSELQAASGEASSMHEYVMRQGNVVASVSGNSSDDVAAVAESFSSRLSGKFEVVADDDGTAQVAKQSVAEACDELAAVGVIDAQLVQDAYFGQNGSDLDSLSKEWDAVLDGVVNDEVKRAGEEVSAALHSLADYRTESGGSGLTDELETTHIGGVGVTVNALSALDPACALGIGTGWGGAEF